MPHYEINISKNGYHYFATSERSLTTLSGLKRVYKELKSIYTEEKGFKISVSHISTISSPIDIEEELMTGELTKGL